jgi:hypothetical protein
VSGRRGDGACDDPLPPSAYSQRWRVWEDELLSSRLMDDADDIEFTTYEVLGEGREA